MEERINSRHDVIATDDNNLTIIILSRNRMGGILGKILAGYSVGNFEDICEGSIRVFTLVCQHPSVFVNP